MTNYVNFLISNFLVHWLGLQPRKRGETRESYIATNEVFNRVVNEKKSHCVLCSRICWSQKTLFMRETSDVKTKKISITIIYVLYVERWIWCWLSHELHEIYFKKNTKCTKFIWIDAIKNGKKTASNNTTWNILVTSSPISSKLYANVSGLNKQKRLF